MKMQNAEKFDKV